MTADLAHWSEMHRVRRTIVVIDLVESVRLLNAYEDDVIRRWRAFLNECRTTVIPLHGGRIVKSLGDGLLLEFDQVPNALNAALALQLLIRQFNVGKDPDSLFWLRAGVHVTEVVVDELDVFGSGVNIAARIAALAGPGEVWLSVEARDEVADGLDVDLEDQGECWVKHLEFPLHVYIARPRGTSNDQRLVMPIDTLVLGVGVAVFPFEWRGDEPGGLVLVDLIADQATASLCRSSHLRVISRWSAREVASRRPEVREAGKLLGADYLITGSAYPINGHVQLFAELVDVATGSVVWTCTPKARLDEVLAGADAIVPSLVSGVSQHIVERELSRSTLAPLPSLDSHRLLMSAVSLIHRSTPRDFARAPVFLEALAERHRRRPQAHAWLAHWHAMSVVQGLTVNRDASGEQALQFSKRALDADPSSSLALTMSGLVSGFLLHDLDAADCDYRRALEANPSDALGWLYTATLRAWQGRGSEALRPALQALSLAPHDPTRYYYDSLAGFAALAAGEHKLAVDLSERSLRAHKTHTSTHRTLGVAWWKLGLEAEARTIIQEMMKIEPSFTAEKYLQRFPGGKTQFAIENSEIFVAAGAPRR